MSYRLSQFRTEPNTICHNCKLQIADIGLNVNGEGWYHWCRTCFTLLKEEEEKKEKKMWNEIERQKKVKKLEPKHQRFLSEYEDKK